MNACRSPYCPCCQSWAYHIGAVEEHMTDCRNLIAESLRNNAAEKRDIVELVVAAAQGQHSRVVNLGDQMNHRQDGETVIERSTAGVIEVITLEIYPRKAG
jgi:hypothetical protein